jgi:hypothetical protein
MRKVEIENSEIQPSRATLWRMRKEGRSYFWKKERETCPRLVSEQEALLWLEEARKCFWLHFSSWYHVYDDMVQEALARAIEISGKKEMTSFRFRFQVYKVAMFNFLQWLCKGKESEE